MTFAEYIPLAMRTQDEKRTKAEKMLHAVCGLTAETDELSIECSEKEIVKEAGDVCWMCAAIADAMELDAAAIDATVKTDELIYMSDTTLKRSVVLLNCRIQKKMQGSCVSKREFETYIGHILFFAIHQAWECCKSKCFEEARDAVFETNIEKLKKRYPNGFDPERSVNRTE